MDTLHPRERLLLNTYTVVKGNGCLLTDPNMHLLFEDGKRGGVSLAMNRFATANNKYMKNYDPGRPSKCIQNKDVNGLYTNILAGPLRFSDFKWMTEGDNDEVMTAYREARPLQGRSRVPGRTPRCA